MSDKGTLFSSFRPPLSTASMSAVEEFGFTTMTPVQASAIPLFLANKDVCVEATTGSGKTLAFCIPIFELLLRQGQGQPPETVSNSIKHTVLALVIAPTRELAVQIFDVFTIFSRHHQHYSLSLFVGGSSVQDNSRDFVSDGGNIIVGTPGRILDIANRTVQVNFKKLEVLVLDEADKLLDMGFRDALNQIFSMLPKQRRTGLFSATQTKEVKELARAGLRNPVTISVRVQHASAQTAAASPGSSAVATSTAQATPTSLDNWYMIREFDQRLEEILTFLRNHLTAKTIVFCATCACVDYYSAIMPALIKADPILAAEKVQAIAFHGKMIAKKRTILYKKFKGLVAGVMFSTDVAARGIDIPDVDWIIQLAAPKDPAFFVHRVGRTARAGRRGGALLFIAPEEDTYVELLRGRGVPLQEARNISDLTAAAPSMEPQESGEELESSPLLEQLKKLAKSDRAILEAGSTAFMSFMRAYKEHLCSYIFRMEHLDIGALGRSYGLLRLPKMAETRGVKGKPIRFDTDPIDTSTIPYRHKEKEEARQRKLAEARRKEEEKDEAEEQHSSSVRSKMAKPWVPAEEFERVDPKRDRKRKKSMMTKFQEEWDELAAEETLFRKFKKGKISKEKYDDRLTSENPMTELDVTEADVDEDDRMDDGDNSSDVDSDMSD